MDDSNARVLYPRRSHAQMFVHRTISVVEWHEQWKYGKQCTHTLARDFRLLFLVCIDWDGDERRKRRGIIGSSPFIMTSKTMPNVKYKTNNRQQTENYTPVLLRLSLHPYIYTNIIWYLNILLSSYPPFFSTFIRILRGFLTFSP